MKRFVCIALCMVIFSINSLAISDNQNNKKIKINTLIDPYSDAFVLDDKEVSEGQSVKKSKTKAYSNDAISSKYDSRDNNIVPEVRSQGSTGACWAFASIASMEIDAVVKGYKTVNDADFSESHLVCFTYSGPEDDSDPLFGEYYFSDDPYLTGGNWQRASGTLSEWVGPAEERNFRFDSDNVEKMLAYPECDRYDLSSGLIIKDTEVFNSSDDVKRWIAEHGSCTASIYWDSAYENNETSSYYCDVGGKGINHMICIVGWDDNYSSCNFNIDPVSNGAWLVRDSWGANNHDNGYFWISYKDATVQSFAGFSCMPAGTYFNNYTYNGIGPTSNVTVNSKSSVANVFVSESDETLKAISVSTVTAQTVIKVEIFKNADSNNPVSGSKVSSFIKTISNRGYHTILLDSPVELSKGQRFSVVVTYMTTDDSPVDIPVEHKNGHIERGSLTVSENGVIKTISHGIAFSSKPGQSYCNFPDYTTGWVESESKDLGNFFIQAFTVCSHKDLFTFRGEGPCNQPRECKEMCRNCGEMIRSYTEPAGSHLLSEWTYAGNGKIEKSCYICNQKFYSDLSIKIKNNVNGVNDKVKYREGIRLTAQYEYLPEGFTVAWYKSGSSIPVETGCTFEEIDIRSDFDVIVKLIDKNGNIVNSGAGKEISDSEHISVKINFWIKLVAFFKYLFSDPIIVNQ